MNYFFKGFLLLTFFLCIGNSYGQVDFNSIDLSRVKPKKVKRYLKQQQKLEKNSFSDLEASVQPDEDVSNFLLFEKKYVVKEPSDVVWHSYKHSSQTEVWDIDKVSFGILFCRDSESLIYSNQTFYGFEEGQIYYVNLKILNGFYNLPVAFEVIHVDTENQFIELSYLKGGRAKGKQIIKIEASENGYTTISHKSFVRSDSKIRDKYLYPFFHNKVINAFHGNMKRTISQNVKEAGVKLVELKY